MEGPTIVAQDFARSSDASQRHFVKLSVAFISRVPLFLFFFFVAECPVDGDDTENDVGNNKHKNAIVVLCVLFLLCLLTPGVSGY